MPVSTVSEEIVTKIPESTTLEANPAAMSDYLGPALDYYDYLMGIHEGRVTFY